MTPLFWPLPGGVPGVDPRVFLKGSLRGEKTHPTPWKRHTNSVVEGVGRDRYGIADTVLSVGVCAGVKIWGVSFAIAPNSSALDGLRKGWRVGFFAPQGQHNIV